MKLRRKTKSGLSIKDRQWIKKQIEAKLSVETLERRELLAADIIGGMADVAEGENDPKVQMRLVATDQGGQPVETVFLNQEFNLQGYVTDLRADAKGVFTCETLGFTGARFSALCSVEGWFEVEAKGVVSRGFCDSEIVWLLISSHCLSNSFKVFSDNFCL